MNCFDLCWDKLCLSYCAGAGTFSLIPGLQIVMKAEREKVTFAIAWVFYAWISVNFSPFYISARDALFAGGGVCQVFFFLNKDFFNELGFTVHKGREIRLFAKLLDHCFSNGEISMFCVQLIQSFRKIFSLNRKFWAFSCVNWNHLTPKYLPFALPIDKPEHHIAYATCFIKWSYLYSVSLASFMLRTT